MIESKKGGIMERKCAIYNRLSTENEEKLKEKREQLIEYCKNVLNIEKFELFEEISSVLTERKKFDEMMSKIDKKEFSDVLVYHSDRIYKPTYNIKKYMKLLKQIDDKAKIHSIKENEKEIKHILKNYYGLYKIR